MAMNQKQQIVVIAVGAVGALYMGYTTLFPSASTYAQQSTEPMIVDVSPVTQTPSETDQEALLITESVAPVGAASTQIAPQTDAHEQDAKVNKINQYLNGNMLNVEPFRLEVDSLSILTQSKSITDATMAAKLREQNQKHVNTAMPRLGIDAPRAQTSTQTSTVRSTSYPVSLFRVGDGPTTARIQYRGQWVKVHPGMALGEITVLRITSKGVTVREDGKTRLLTPRDS